VSAGEYDVPVHPEALLTQGDWRFEMFLTGYGVRKKRVVFIDVDVYFSAHYLTKPARSISADPISHIRNSQAECLILTILRDLSGDDIKNSLRQSLQLNNIDPNRAEFVSIFDQLGRGARSGEQILLLSYTHPDTGNDSVYAVMPDGAREVTGRDIGLWLWHVWFGIPVDDWMRVLKSQLVGG
jgi:hypothetical protein